MQSSGNSCSNLGPRLRLQYPWVNPACLYTLRTYLREAIMAIATSQAKSLTPQTRMSQCPSLYADFSSSQSDARAHAMRESHRFYRLR